MSKTIEQWLQTHVSCRVCKFWEKAQKPDEDYIEWTESEHLGKCTRIIHGGMEAELVRDNDNKDYMAGTYDGENYKSGLITNADFSCKLGRHDR